ncbi:MAG: ABC transporter, substrate-binding protein (cluster 4, leucine/isoleucine/valine/benzoate), partial [uncultured Ramlibacter sp.]
EVGIRSLVGSRGVRARRLGPAAHHQIRPGRRPVRPQWLHRREHAPAHAVLRRQGQRRRRGAWGTQDRGAHLRQPVRPARDHGAAAEGDRQRRAVRLPRQQFRGGACDRRLPGQAQPPQPRQDRRVHEFRGARPGSHQRQVQLLALPVGRRRRHPYHRHHEPAQEGHGDQEGVPAEPGLLVRQGHPRCHGPATQGEAARRGAGGKRADPAAEGHRLHALRLQDP